MSGSFCSEPGESAASMRGIEIRAFLADATCSRGSSGAVGSGFGMHVPELLGYDVCGGESSRARLPQFSFAAWSVFVWVTGSTLGSGKSVGSVPTPTSQSSSEVCTALSLVAVQLTPLSLTACSLWGSSSEISARNCLSVRSMHCVIFVLRFSGGWTPVLLCFGGALAWFPSRASLYAELLVGAVSPAACCVWGWDGVSLGGGETFFS